MHMASTKISTTPPTPRFTMEFDDWNQEIAPDTFEDDLRAEGGVEDEKEDVGEGETSEATGLEPKHASAVDDIL